MNTISLCVHPDINRVLGYISSGVFKPIPTNTCITYKSQNSGYSIQVCAIRISIYSIYYPYTYIFLSFRVFVCVCTRQKKTNKNNINKYLYNIFVYTCV